MFDDMLSHRQPISTLLPNQTLMDKAHQHGMWGG